MRADDGLNLGAQIFDVNHACRNGQLYDYRPDQPLGRPQHTQGFIDGAGPDLPAPLARYGIKFLGTKFLRMQANQMAYSDKEKYATNDAMLIGRLHTYVAGWEDAQLR